MQIENINPPPLMPEAITVQLLQEIDKKLAAIKKNLKISFAVSQGKRIRSRVHLSSFFCFYNNEGYFDIAKNQLVDTAVGIELLHEATLIHDDILDNAKIRRNEPTIHNKFNKNIAIVTGDLLLAKALELILGAGDNSMKNHIGAKLILAARMIAEGELMQQLYAYDQHRNVPFLNEYMQHIRYKTGSLFSIACEAGAMYTTADKPSIAQLRDFGMAFGTAYQIMDDLDDMLGDVKKADKDMANDMHTGKMTLPYIVGFSLLKEDSASLKKDIKTGRPLKVKKRLTGVGAIDRSIEILHDYVTQARESIQNIPNRAGRKMLLETLNIIEVKIGKWNF